MSEQGAPGISQETHFPTQIPNRTCSDKPPKLSNAPPALTEVSPHVCPSLFDRMGMRKPGVFLTSLTASMWALKAPGCLL